jgi:putative ABC transport system permease protein
MSKQQQTPPEWIDALLEWYCSSRYIDEVQGDLHEWFFRRVKRQGIRKARWFYLLDVIRFCRSYRLKSYDEFTQNSNNAAMLKNYFKTSWRALSKNKAFTIINILGLTIGMVAFMMISLYVENEYNYDQFHTQKDDIYRLKQNRYNKGELTTEWAAGCTGVGPDLHNNFPEVKEFVRMTKSQALITYEDKVFQEDHAYYTNSAFFKVFSIPIVKGDTSVLSKAYNMMISESTAKKYFGEADPVGKTIRHNGARDYNIAGVYQDIPTNSHMKADMLFSFETFVDLSGPESRTTWDWDGFYTYLLLEKGTDYKDFEAKIPAFILQERGEDLKQRSAGIEFLLQPITSIHLTSDYMMEFKPNGDGEATSFLFIVAIFIIIIAWVNYVNLSTAKSIERAREVGVRKVMGSLRGQLVKQFLVESSLVNFIAISIAVLVVYLTLPAFGDLSGRALVLDFTSQSFLLMPIGLFVIGSLLSGAYPAFVLSGFAPVAILSGKLSTSTKGSLLRKGLVTFQFIASLVLIIGTYVVYSQLDFMRSQDIGVDIEQTLVVKGPGAIDSTYSNQLNVFKQQLAQQSDILSVSASTAVPGSQPGWNAGGIRLLSKGEDEANQYRVIGMDAEFMQSYDLDLMDGRIFDEKFSTEENNVIFNQSAMRLIGFKDAKDLLNQEIYFWGDTFNIVGVVKDYHQESLKKSFEPLIFRYIPNSTNYYSVKVQSSDMSYTIAKIEEEYNAAFVGNPFDFFFLDDHFNQQYKAEMQFGKVFGVFASLAILIACLGLFGLTSYMTVLRTKEIGVRKVLGASLISVMTLLSKDFAKLMLVAILIATPIAWYVMNNWLDGFAYQINLAWWVFVLPSVVLISLLMVTVSLQTVKAGMSNPVDALKHE